MGQRRSKERAEGYRERRSVRMKERQMRGPRDEAGDLWEGDVQTGFLEGRGALYAAMLFQSEQMVLLEIARRGLDRDRSRRHRRWRMQSVSTERRTLTSQCVCLIRLQKPWAKQA